MLAPPDTEARTLRKWKPWPLPRSVHSSFVDNPKTGKQVVDSNLIRGYGGRMKSDQQLGVGATGHQNPNNTVGPSIGSH